MRDRTLPLAEVGSSASASDLRSSARAGCPNFFVASFGTQVWASVRLPPARDPLAPGWEPKSCSGRYRILGHTLGYVSSSRSVP